MVRSATLTVLGESPPPPQSVPTAIELTATPTTGTIPFDVQLTGRLVRADTLQGLGGMDLDIYLDGNRVGRTGTFSNGVFNASVRVTLAGVHSIYVEFAGIGIFQGCAYPEPLESAFQSVLRID